MGDPRKRSFSYSLAIGSALGWVFANVALFVLGNFFGGSFEYNAWHFLYVPSILVGINLCLIHFEVLSRLGLRSIYQTTGLTAMHGIWAEYISLQVDSRYNGFLMLFLFSIGLVVLKATAGFVATLSFSVANVFLALVFIQVLGIDLGLDEKLFLFFFAFSGVSSAFMNEVSRRNYATMRRQEMEIKELNALLAKDINTEKKRTLHAYDQMEKVFYPHQLQLIQDGRSLSESMPVGAGYACVLALDLIGSTSFRHVRKKEIIREFLTECSQLMAQSYVAEPLASEGFRIKETGDGFLCSVGFPFPTPGGEEKSQVALHLAHIFIEALARRVADFEPQNRIYCCVGIAHGPVEGFFTHANPIQYETYGQGVVLATRYEQMRKNLFSAEALMSSLIILQEDVYYSLPKSDREKFTEVDLGKVDLQVRDDPGAHRLFYRLASEHSAPKVISKSA